MKKLFFTVTNDLTYDQRMHRICSSLAAAGYHVTLIGRQLKDSKPLELQSFYQKRLPCFFYKGLLFYAEYNLRLLFFLMFKKADAICAIDLDTIIPVLCISKLKKIRRIYDAHEYFTEMKEVRSRPFVKAIWQTIAKFCIPRFKYAYTVGDGLAEAFGEKYKVKFTTISNFPKLTSITFNPTNEPYIFFGGAVNEARAFEYLIPAMQYIKTRLIVAGDGNFMPQLKALLVQYKVENKVELKGMLPPLQLRAHAEKATLGLGLTESEGTNQYLALPNKFADYMHAGLPQVTMNFPEYKKINEKFKIAVLINDLDAKAIAETINNTIADKELLLKMRAECLKARQVYNWDGEEKKLLQFYQSLFNE